MKKVYDQFDRPFARQLGFTHTFGIGPRPSTSGARHGDMVGGERSRRRSRLTVRRQPRGKRGPVGAAGATTGSPLTTERDPRLVRRHT